MSKGYHFSNLIYVVNLNLNRHNIVKISVACCNKKKDQSSFNQVTNNRPWVKTNTVSALPFLLGGQLAVPNFKKEGSEKKRVPEGLEEFLP